MVAWMINVGVRRKEVSTGAFSPVRFWACFGKDIMLAFCATGQWGGWFRVREEGDGGIENGKER